jgi:hypothetical protein
VSFEKRKRTGQAERFLSLRERIEVRVNGVGFDLIQRAE